MCVYSVSRFSDFVWTYKLLMKFSIPCDIFRKSSAQNKTKLDHRVGSATKTVRVRKRRLKLNARTAITLRIYFKNQIIYTNNRSGGLGVRWDSRLFRLSHPDVRDVMNWQLRPASQSLCYCYCFFYIKCEYSECYLVVMLSDSLEFY